MSFDEKIDNIGLFLQDLGLAASKVQQMLKFEDRQLNFLKIPSICNLFSYLDITAQLTREQLTFLWRILFFYGITDRTQFYDNLARAQFFEHKRRILSVIYETEELRAYLHNKPMLTTII
jgi:hypothetical protein